LNAAGSLVTGSHAIIIGNSIDALDDSDDYQINIGGAFTRNGSGTLSLYHGTSSPTLGLTMSSTLLTLAVANGIKLNSTTGTVTAGDKQIVGTTDGVAYNTLATKKHSFQVDGVEVAVIDSTGFVGAGGATKYAADIGDGSTNPIVVTHSLGTRDVFVTVYDNSSPYEEFGVTTKHTSTSTITLEFAVTPTTNQYRVVVM
jgi:hypothetical protein